MGILLFIGSGSLSAQQISREELLFLTPLWKGERFADGRPKVPDGILKRMKLVSIEEAWAVLKNEGYGYQIAEDWPIQINPGVNRHFYAGPQRHLAGDR